MKRTCVNTWNEQEQQTFQFFTFIKNVKRIAEHQNWRDDLESSGCQQIYSAINAKGIIVLRRGLP